MVNPLHPKYLKARELYQTLEPNDSTDWISQKAALYIILQKRGYSYIPERLEWVQPVIAPSKVSSGVTLGKFIKGTFLRKRGQYAPVYDGRAKTPETRRAAAFHQANKIDINAVVVDGVIYYRGKKGYFHVWSTELKHGASKRGLPNAGNGKKRS